MLGLVEVNDGIAGDVLRALGAESSAIRRSVETLLARGDSMRSTGPLPFSPDVKKLLGSAVEAARHFGHDYVGTEHLLLGVVRRQGSIGARALESVGVTALNAYEKILLVLDLEPPDGTLIDGTTDAFDNLTDAARTLMNKAHDAARERGNDHLSTGHLLLGIARDGDTVAARALHSLGVDARKLHDAVDALLAHSTARLPFTPKTKAALKLAADEARELGTDGVGPEHVLLGLLAGQDSVATQVLRDLGIDRERLRSLIESGEP